MKRILIFLFFSLTLFSAQAQTYTGIGKNVEADRIRAKQTLDLPYLSTTERDDLKRVTEGMMIYNKTTDAVNIYSNGEWTVAIGPTGATGADGAAGATGPTGADGTSLTGNPNSVAFFGGGGSITTGDIMYDAATKAFQVGDLTGTNYNTRYVLADLNQSHVFTTTGYFSLQNPSSNEFIRANYNSGNPQVSIGAVGGTYGNNVVLTVDDDNDIISFNAGNIVSQGNVGIGTPTPTKLLDVYSGGSTRFTVDDSGNEIISNVGNVGNIYGYAAYFQDNPLYVWSVKKQGTGATWLYMDGNNFRFGDYDNAANGTNIEIIDASQKIIFTGNIGVGTSSPAQKFHVNGKSVFTNGNVGIGTTDPVGLLHVDDTGGSIRFVTGNEAAGKVWTSDVNGNGDWGAVIATSTYTPTLTNTANLDASTAYELHYTRINDMVFFSGQVDADITAGGALTQLGVSIPIASDFTLTGDAGGSGGMGAIAGPAIAVRADETNNRLLIEWTGSMASTANQPLYFSGSYRIR